MNAGIRALLLFHAIDKLLFFTIAPNRPIEAWHAGIMTESALALFFVIHIFCYRLFPLLGGYLADKFSKTAVIALGSVLQSIGLVALCQTDSLYGLYAMGALIGIGGGILNPAIYSMLSTLAGDEGKRAFSLHYVLINVGAMLGPLLIWPVLGSHTLWLLPALAASAFWAMRVWHNSAVTLAKSGPVLQSQYISREAHGWLAPLRDKYFLKIFCLFATIWACYTMIFSSTPLISSELGFTPQGNVWLGLNSVTVLLAFAWESRKASDKTISWSKIQIGLLLTVVGVLMVGAAPSVWVVAAGIVLLSVGELMSIPLLYSLVAEHAPTVAKSRYFGFIWVAGAVGEAGAQLTLWACSSPRLVCFLAAASLAAMMFFFRSLNTQGNYSLPPAES